MTVVLRLYCRDCHEVFVAHSDIAYLADPITKEPLKCPECDSEDLAEIETLQVG